MGENLKLSTAACGLQFLSWAFCLILRLRSQITGFSFRVTAFSFRIRAYSFRIRGFSFRIRVLVSEPGVFSFRIFLVSESGFLVSESGVLVSESGVLVSEPGVLVSESGVLVSEPGRHHTMGMQWQVLDEEEIPVGELHCWLKRATETFCDDECVNVWEGLYFIVKKFVVDPKTGLASVCVYDVPDQQFKIYFFR